MNREFLHKITLLGCLFLLITSSSGTDNGFQTPEQDRKSTRLNSSH